MLAIHTGNPKHLLSLACDNKYSQHVCYCPVTVQLPSNCDTAITILQKSIAAC